MKLNVLLSISAVYLALVGLGFLFIPSAIMFGTVDPGAPAALIANLRVLAGSFIGIAVLNWLARDVEPSKARDAIVLSNAVGFALAGILDVVAVTGGAPAMELVPAVINLAFAATFLWLGQASMSTAKG